MLLHENMPPWIRLNLQRCSVCRCRTDPYLMRILLHYTKRSKISPSFLEAWQHYKKVGLPPIPWVQQHVIINSMTMSIISILILNLNAVNYLNFDIEIYFFWLQICSIVPQWRFSKKIYVVKWVLNYTLMWFFL